MKLVINSCHGYETPRTSIFKSLAAAGFARFADVVLVMGKCPEDRGPRTVPVDELCDGPTGAPAGASCTCIELASNNYDLNGYNALHLYRDHADVASESYFYCLDTCVFHREFVKFFDTFAPPAPDAICTCPFPNSNVSAFGAAVVANYGDNFGSIVSKEEGLLLEHDRPAETESGAVVRPLSSFGEVHKTARRRFVGLADPFRTGHKRRVYHYPAFGVSKYILWSQTGDLGGGQVRGIRMPPSKTKTSQ